MKKILFCLVCMLGISLCSCAKPDASGSEPEEQEQGSDTPDTPGPDDPDNPGPDDPSGPENPDDPGEEEDGLAFGIDPLGSYAPVRILFIGNSHTLDSTDLLPLMLNGEGVRNIEFTRVYHGGYYIVGYNANYDNPSICSITTWQPGQDIWRGNFNLTHSLREAVEDAPYDIVVIQEYTGNSHCWEWDDTERDAIRALCDKILEANPNAELVYFLSHCHASSYSICTNNFGGSHVRQFETCVSENAAHVMDPEEGFPFGKIISTGALIENLRTSALDPGDGTDMLRGDGCHLDYGLSRVAASLLFWKTIIEPCTGIKAKDVKFRISEYQPGFVRRRTPITDANWDLVNAAVDAAFEHPLEITDMSAYTADTRHENVPGSFRFDGPGVDIIPVRFPVEFPVTYAYNTSTTQGYWNGYALWQSAQPQAFARWVPVSFPVDGLMYNRTFANSKDSNISSVALDAVWTGDYFEFTIPVKNFRAGTTVRVDAPFYTRQGPCFWYLDYEDGGEWRCSHSQIPTWDGAFERDATFAIAHGKTRITQDVTFENGISEGYLRFRFRCADGSIQATADGAVQRETPNIAGGEFSSVFYFWGDPGKVSFSIVE